MKTTNHIIIATLIALLVPAVAGANIYEDRLKEAFGDIVNAVPHKDLSQMHTTYTDPETGVKEGLLDVYKFTIDSGNVGLINNAKEAYEQLNGNSNADVFVLWWNDNDDGSFQGYRLYYNPDNTIVVGLACDHCYTVGFVAPDDKQHRTTYTLEWSKNDDNDSISGRLITTYAPIKAKAASDGSRLNAPGNINGHILAPGYTLDIETDNFDKWIEQLQADMETYHIKDLGAYQKNMEKYQAAIEKVLAAKEKALAAKEKALAAKEKAQAAKETVLDEASVVRGEVTDENGEPLIGAMVASVDKRYGTATDYNGEFSLSLPDHVKTLKVSYVGYKTQVLSVEPNMVIIMIPGKSDDNELSDLFLRVPRDKSLTPSQPNAKDWMKKLLFYINKIQENGDRYLYLSKLYELCKDTDGLDQTDLKIGMQQLASVYKQLKSKSKLKENELIFLESMVDLLENKTKSIHYWNPD
jgi:hypothetical protein